MNKVSFAIKTKTKNKKLKGKRFFITKNLTENTVKALKATQTKYGMINVWTSDGRIFFKVNNKVHKFLLCGMLTLWKKLAFGEKVTVVVYLV